jgi:DNA-binding transcriptional LysR family regulator
MNYTLHQLQVFLKVAELSSVTKAAEELHLTQPAVSIQLKNFQNQFDIPLSEVVGRQLYITDFGREVAAAAERILAEVESINYRTMAYKGHLSGRLKLSVVSTGKYVMPYFLSDFINANEGVELQMDVTNRARVIESLDKNEVDFSLVSVLPDSLAVENLKLMQNKLYLVASTQNSYTNKKYGKEIFETLPMIFRENGSATRMVVEKYIADNSLKVKRAMELTSNEAVKQAVMAGLGVSVMPLIGLKNELDRGELQIIPVSRFPIRSTWQLVWMRHKKFSPVAYAFLEYIKSQKDKIIADKFEWYERY